MALKKTQILATLKHLEKRFIEKMDVKSMELVEAKIIDIEIHNKFIAYLKKQQLKVWKKAKYQINEDKTALFISGGIEHIQREIKRIEKEIKKEIEEEQR